MKRLKQRITGGLAVAAMLIGGLAFTTSTAPVAATGGSEFCYAPVKQAQYKKATAPTGTDDWSLYGSTWWQGQANKWWPDRGNVVEGPFPLWDGLLYRYESVAQRTVNGDQIPCPQPPTPKDKVTEKYGVCTPGSDTVPGKRTTATYAWNLDGLKWVLTESSTSENISRLLTEDEQKECRPDAKVVPGEWFDGTYECDDTTVKQTRIVITTPYIYVDGKWVEDPTGATKSSETRIRDLTTDEIKPCPPPVTDPPPVTTNPPPVTTNPPPVTTEPPVTTAPPEETPTTEAPTTTTAPPEERPEDTEPVEGEGGTVPPTDESTSTTTPEPTAVSTTTPPVAGQGGPVPPTATPAGTLPQTGAGSTGIMQVGALLLLAGAAAFFAARRRTPEAA